MTKILIIEDDKFLQKAYQGIFNTSEYELFQATDGEEGIAAAQDKKPDIILLDMMMPKINGIEVLKKLKNLGETKNIPIIVLSNLSGDQMIQETQNLGASKYMVKSNTNPVEIEAAVKEVLQNKQAN